MTDQRKCPYCAELVKIEAILCKHCHSKLDPSSDDQSVEQQEDLEVSRLDPEPKKLTAPKMPAKWFWGYFFLPLLLAPLSNIAYPVATFCTSVTALLWLICWVFLFCPGFRLKGVVLGTITFFSFSHCVENQTRLEPEEIKTERIEKENTEAIKESQQRQLEEQQAQEAKEQEESTNRAEQNKSAPSIGEKGFVNQQCLAADSQAHWDEHMDALQSNDQTGALELMVKGHVAIFDEGQEILVLKAKGFLGSIREVRILSGQHSGEKWFFPYEFLSRVLETH